MAYNNEQVYASAKVAAAQAQVSIPAAAGLYSYVTGIVITGAGATAATVLDATLSDGTVTLHYAVVVPAGATTAITPIVDDFLPPLQSTAVNTAWTLTVPTAGAGNTNVSVAITGYQQA